MVYCYSLDAPRGLRARRLEDPLGDPFRDPAGDLFGMIIIDVELALCLILHPLLHLVLAKVNAFSERDVFRY